MMRRLIILLLIVGCEDNAVKKLSLTVPNFDDETIPYACVKSIGHFNQYNLSELDCDTLFSNPDSILVLSLDIPHSFTSHSLCESYCIQFDSLTVIATNEVYECIRYETCIFP